MRVVWSHSSARSIFTDKIPVIHMADELDPRHA
jgi:hypothetical protein